MKIFFFADGRAMVAEFADESLEPECTASFPLTAKQSTFASRYALENGKLVDKYPGKTDEDVATLLQEAEAAKAAELAAKLAAPAA